MNGSTDPRQPDRTGPGPVRPDGDRSVHVRDNYGVISTGDNAHVFIEAPAPPAENSVAGKANLLADRVSDFLKREEEQLRLWDPVPLPLRCRPVPRTLADGRNSGPGPWAGAEAVLPLDLEGPLEDLAVVYEGTRPGRLLVLGRAGSGKTILIRRFAKARLEARTPTGEAPVPVIFSLGSWNPATTPLRDWLIDRLERDYPFLAGASPDGSTTWAEALIGADRVLAILDGFDEIADGLHKDALRDLTTTTVPLLMTSRRPELEDAVKTPMFFAGIELTDLTLDDSVDYLMPTSVTARRTDAGTTAPTGWEYVLNRLRLHPDEPACANLSAVLTTPLMVTLARTVYSSGRDPARLLTDKELSTREALEDHLLDNFVPTAYARFLSHRPDTERRPWRSERAQHWLGYLATHLKQLDTHDIEWWRLGTAMSLPSRMLVSGITTGLATGTVLGLAPGFATLRETAFNLLLHVLGIGLAFGLVHGVMSKLRVGGAFEPSRMRIRIRGGSKRVKENLLPRIFGGLAGGLVFGVVYGFGLAVYFTALGHPWFVALLIFGEWSLVGLGIGLGAGLTLGLMTGVEALIETKSSVSPSDLLNTNRTTVLAQVLAMGLTVGLGYGTVVATINNLTLGVASGIVTGVMVAIGACTLTAWGRWVVLVRIWLPLTGRLPRAVNAFLDDAYERGVLRRAGAVYQFRHARLRDRLAEAHGQHKMPTTATGDR
ncbi:NACHT domain-containing protein [Streptomyces sp. NBC_00654]|uniref:NACHT domain-containing protein n=1 Tax=Streptomyces sp. NBC_00654 TaxID=2975799 RepID=UPI00225437FB|nr:NACHT domain-containing protein [Streptomyces sp. NBC_00654]MCX4966643.1 NACHT domain-containing protein [Streptomyces sp. NBC_00654]